MIDDANYCSICGGEECVCVRDPCRVCGGSGCLYDEDDPINTWECCRCGGDGWEPDS